MSILKYKVSQHETKVHHGDNDKLLGSILMMEDGYFAFFPDFPHVYGGWDALVLRELADYLDTINAQWDKYVQDTCGGECG